MAEEGIGLRIRALRESRRMTQEELGAILGMSKTDIEGLESGISSNLRADKIKLVCETFHEYPGFLLYGHGHDYWKGLFASKAQSIMNSSDGLGGVNVQSLIRKAVEDTLGTEGLPLLNSIRLLNELGQNRARSLVEDLLMIKEYRK